MSSNLKAAVGEKEAAAIRKRLGVWAKTRNSACADCSRSNPTWASVNLGVLVCLECAGRHRSLGTHISKMRSITLDTILPEEAFFLLNMTNALANKYWEATLSDSERVSAIQGSHFISQKYGDRRWALSDNSVPVPSAQCVPHTHPWWRDGQTAAAAPAAAPAAPAAPQQKPVLQVPVKKAPPKAPVASVPAPAPAAQVADLIDFGDFESAPEPPVVAKNADSDPFRSTSTSFAAEPATATTRADPFACTNGSMDIAQAGVGMPASTSEPQLVKDPFAGMSDFPSSASVPSGLHAAQQFPRHSSAPGQVAEQPGIPAAPATFMSQTGAQAAPQRPSAASSPGLPTGGAGAAETKAAMNARILALYNSTPTPSPATGSASSNAGLFGGAGVTRPMMQNASDPGMMHVTQGTHFSSASALGSQGQRS